MKLNGFGNGNGSMRAMFITALLATAACSGNPAQPTAAAPQPPALTPPMIKTAPVITSLTVSPRVESEDDVALVATVEDADTPLDKLQYEWSVVPARGTFIGTGREVTWRAPRGE